jgi:2-oxoglutarate dehydrogenase E1 component
MRTPLVVISPKSLLRNPMAVSSLDDHTKGSFKCVINDTVDDKSLIKKVILCSGKVFYDLKERQSSEQKNHIAIVRIEQLYPFPYDDLEGVLKEYKNVKEIIWCQEEPQNQGAWFSHRHRLQRVLDRLKENQEIALVSRPPAAAPAVGMMKLHLEQQSNLVSEALQ